MQGRQACRSGSSTESEVSRSLCMRRLFIALLAFPALLWAQGESPESCTQCVCVADGSCSFQEGTCDGTTTLDCNAVNFTASCSANYHLRAVLTCANGTENCKFCFACVQLYEGGTLIGSTHTSCQSDDCVQIDPTAYALVVGHTYTLVTCLRACGAGDEYCENCLCTARGYAYINWNDCNTIPACNP